MATRMQVKRDTAARWLQTNPVLADGQVGFEKDTRYMKIGNGVSTWAQLPYLNYYTTGSKVADSEMVDGVSLEGLIQTGDVTEAATALKIPRRTADGGLRVTPATDNDEATTLAQLNSGIVAARQRILARSVAAGPTLQASDAGGVVQVANGVLTSTMSVSVPTNSNVPFPIGTTIDIVSTGIGTLRVLAVNPGVTTIRGDNRIYGQYGIGRLMKVGTDEWILIQLNRPKNAFARCFAYMASTVQGWGSGWKHMPCNAETIDTHNGHITGTITGEDTDSTTAKQTNRYTVQPGQEGTYELFGQVNLTVAQSATTHSRWLKNGVWLTGGTGLIGGTSISGVTHTGVKQVELIEGDYVGLQGYCGVSNWNTVSDEAANGGATTYFAIQRIN